MEFAVKSTCSGRLLATEGNAVSCICLVLALEVHIKWVNSRWFYEWGSSRVHPELFLCVRPTLNLDFPILYF